MDTERIRILLKVLEEGSLSAAAEALGYTPSGISRSIAALEEEIGFPLLLRQRRGVLPTGACEEMLPAFRRSLAAAEQLHREAEARKGLHLGTLRIGSSYDSYFPYLTERIGAFSRRFPGVRIALFEDTSSALGAAVAEGRADLAVISRRDGEFDWLPLERDALLAVLPRNHPLAGAAAFPLERLSEEAYIEIHPGRETDNSRLLSALEIRPRVRFACGDSLAALSLVEAGLGVTLVNALLLENWHGRTAALPLEPPQELEIGIACPRTEALSPAAHEFLAMLG